MKQNIHIYIFLDHLQAFLGWKQGKSLILSCSPYQKIRRGEHQRKSGNLVTLIWNPWIVCSIDEGLHTYVSVHEFFTVHVHTSILLHFDTFFGLIKSFFVWSKKNLNRKIYMYDFIISIFSVYYQIYVHVIKKLNHHIFMCEW